MLGSISDKALLLRLEQLRRAERGTTVEILHHLNEVERRQLHLRRGYSSLFGYCTQHLRYSESAAGRRVQAARALRRFPRVAGLLESGDINLMTLGLVATILTPSNVDDLLNRIRGRTQREVEAIASAYRPPIKLRDRIRHVNVAAPTTSTLVAAPGVAAAAQPCPITPDEAMFVNPATNSQTGSEKARTVSTVRKLYIQFLADEDFMEKYNEACALLSNKMTRPSFEAVFKALLEEFITRHSPSKRHARREQRILGKARMNGHRVARG